MNKSTKRGCRYWIKLLSVGLVGGLLLACMCIEVVYIVVMANPAPSPINTNPGDLGFEYEDVAFPSYDNIQLSGWYIPSQNGAIIILLHGYGANRTELIRHVEILARHGYGVLIYDLRGHGQSGGKQRTYGWLDIQDVKYALDYLDHREEVNKEHIGIFGFSIGGQIAIRVASEIGQIQAIFADDPGFVTVKDAPPPTTTWERLMYLTNWIDFKGMQLWTGVHEPPGVVEVINELSPRPLFLVATGGPGNRLMHHYYELAGEPKTLWEIPEATHGKSLTARPQEYEEKMVAFYENSLLKK
jgi:pimeloyl-ACP methyl ester carboxylesterase